MGGRLHVQVIGWRGSKADRPGRRCSAGRGTTRAVRHHLARCTYMQAPPYHVRLDGPAGSHVRAEGPLAARGSRDRPRWAQGQPVGAVLLFSKLRHGASRAC